MQSRQLGFEAAPAGNGDQGGGPPATSNGSPRRAANGADRQGTRSLEAWIWDAASSIRGAKDAPKYKDYILPLIFAKRLCDVFDDEVDRLAKELGGSRKAARELIDADHGLVRFYIPLKPTDPEADTWDVVRVLSSAIGEQLTNALRLIAGANPRLKGIVDRVDFNATTHGVRDLADDRLSDLIERISTKRLGLEDVEPDVIGRSYEYLIRKFAEGSVSSAGEFYTPTEVGVLMAHILDPEPGMSVYDPCCGSAGLLVKCQLVVDDKRGGETKRESGHLPLKVYGQEYVAETWAMANMNTIIHDMEAELELGDSFKAPKHRDAAGRPMRFDRVTANPMWNQDWFKEEDYDADEWGRFPAGFPGGKADWGWVQVMHSALNERGRAAIVLDTGAASRGSGSAGSNRERDARRWFVERDVIEGVVYLPENLFYNTSAPGIVLFLDAAKPAERRGKVFLLNASKEFTKGNPKNYLAAEAVGRIADTFRGWEEIEGYSRAVPVEEIARNDFNISPSRYIHTTAEQEHRPISEILDELETLEVEAIETSRQLRALLGAVGA